MLDSHDGAWGRLDLAYKHIETNSNSHPAYPAADETVRSPDVDDDVNGVDDDVNGCEWGLANDYSG